MRKKEGDAAVITILYALDIFLGQMETIYFARWILLENGEILQNGALSVSNNRITYVGSRSKARKNKNDSIINLGDTLLLPGLINMHTHLEESCIRGIPKGADETFACWSAKKKSRINQYSRQQIESSIRLSVRELISNGTTTIVDSSKLMYSANILENELIRSWVINEFYPEDTSQENESVKHFISKVDTQVNRRVKFGIGPYALFSTAPEIQRNLITFCLHHNIPWLCHIAESAEELQVFAEKKGDLYFQITRKRDWPFGDTHMGSLHFALENKLIPPNGICVHCNYSSGMELSRLASQSATIVHCPTYSERMNHKRLPIDVILNRNVRICIGTEGDSEPGAMNLFDELFFLKQQYSHIPASEMIKWVTSNAAEALGAKEYIGTLSEGKFADVIGIRFPFDDSSDLLELALQSDHEIVIVMIDGQEVIANY